MSEAFLLDGAQASIGGVASIVPGSPAGRPLVIGIHGGGFGHGYFTGLHPLSKRAAEHGADTFVLDRPGAGESAFKGRSGDILNDNASALDEAIATLWKQYGEERPGVFVVGHSIGGAISLLIAGRKSAWPLLGVSVSGIGWHNSDQPPAADAPERQPLMPREAMKQIFMAPGQATDAAVDSMLAGSVQTVTEELFAIHEVWPPVIEKTLKAIERPVQLIMAEYDALWVVDSSAIKELQTLETAGSYEFTHWLDVGHCIDFHDAAPEFHEAVFAFMDRCVAEKSPRDTEASAPIRR